MQLAKRVLLEFGNIDRLTYLATNIDWDKIKIGDYINYNPGIGVVTDLYSDPVDSAKPLLHMYSFTRIMFNKMMIGAELEYVHGINGTAVDQYKYAAGQYW